MIKFIVARGPDDKFEDYLEPSLKQFPEIEILQIHNSEHLNSMASKYNFGIDELIKNELSENDVVGFVHSDVKIIDPLFPKKIEMVFKKRKKVGLVGLIGTTSFPEAGGWWLCPYEFHRGHLQQGKPGSNGKETYHLNRKIGYFEDLVSVDGFSFFSKGSVLKQVRFDEVTYPEAYHFYDCDFSFSVLEKGFDIAIMDSFFEHSSEGPLPESWHVNKDKFLNKWKSKGFKFPVDKGQFKK